MQTIITNQMSCQHKKTKEVIMPEGHKQYSKILCFYCGSFIKWGPKAKDFHKGEKLNRADEIYLLNNNHPLNDWERMYINSIYKYDYLTPAQDRVYQRIVKKYLFTPTFS